MYTVERKGACPVRAWTHDVAHDVMEQLVATATLPCVGPHVAAMPDVHLGIGATVGAVIPTRGAVIPAAVGVDIGCGMLAVELNRSVEQLPDSLRMTRLAIEERLPVGTKIHEDVVAKDRAKRLEPGLERILERTPAIATRRPGTRMDRVFPLARVNGRWEPLLRAPAKHHRSGVADAALGLAWDRFANRNALHRRGQGVD